MERVQFQQEQMLAELKDFVQKGIFTKAESNAIMKKRTAFETALVRRIPKKADFLRYAAYEMSLDALRRKRVERLKIKRNGPSVSDFSLTRRQFQIFERALKKFKEDVSLWIQYIQAAQRAGARALVSRVCGRALQLHPNVPSLYILAGAHELKHLSHAAARVLLQRGIRLNKEDADLWREYVKMELGFVEALRRRWSILGLIDNEDAFGQGHDQGAPTDVREDATTSAPPVNDDVNENDEQARKAVLDGAIVKAVISNAAETLPTLELFSGVHTVIDCYPCPKKLRRSLLDHLHALLYSAFLEPPPQMVPTQGCSKRDPRMIAEAAKLFATRYLTTDIEGESLIDALRHANEELLKMVHAQKNEEVESSYAQFLKEWFNKSLDEHINLYLLSTLQIVCNQIRSPVLLSAHLHLLRSPHNPQPLTPQKLLKLARKYSSWATNSQSIWLARLELEAALEQEGTVPDANWRKSWADARRLLSIECPPLLNATPASMQISTTKSFSEGSTVNDSVWLWGLDHQIALGANLHDQISSVETLLREARANPTSSLYETLLVRYIHLLHQSTRTQSERRSSLERVSTLYSASSSIWASAFEIFAENAAPKKRRSTSCADQQPDATSNFESDEEISQTQGEVETGIGTWAGTDAITLLRLIFEKWRVISASAHCAAALRIARYLVRRGEGQEAARIISTARRALIGDGQQVGKEVETFDKNWRNILEREDEAMDAEPGNGAIVYSASNAVVDDADEGVDFVIS